MDWKYKRFGRVKTFPQAPDAVLVAARRFMLEHLGWKVSDANPGFEARGSSFLHAAVARFHVEATPEGARLIIELLVERASMLGFMLFDVGGYFDGQIGHWLEGIDAVLDGKSPEAVAAARPPSTRARFLSFLILFTIVSFAFAYLIGFVLFPIIGITTGVLYMPTRGDSDLALHGVAARVASAAMLAFDVFIAYRLVRFARRGPPPRILGER